MGLTTALADAEYALTLAQQLTATNIDIVGIYNGSTQVYTNARPLKASVRETSKIMEHPAETGVMLQDHKIINPVEITLPLVVNAMYYAALYQQIKTDFLASTQLSVKTPVNYYTDMIIADMPHEESPEHFNAIIMELHLKQVIFEIPGFGASNTFAPSAPQDYDTVQSGLQQAFALGKQALAGATAVVSYASVLGRIKQFV